MNQQCGNSETHHFVLLEDDSLLSLMWSIEAKRQGYRLWAFTDQEELLEYMDDFPESAVFLLDNNLFDECDVGRRLARRIRAIRPEAVIIMQTGDFPSVFLGELHDGVIDCVLGKEPDFETAIQFAEIKRERRVQKPLSINNILNPIAVGQKA